MKAITKNRGPILVGVAVAAAIALLVVSILGLITIPVITPDQPKRKAPHHHVTKPHKKHAVVTHKGHHKQKATTHPSGGIGVRTPLAPRPKQHPSTPRPVPKRVPKKARPSSPSSPSPKTQQPPQQQVPTQTTMQPTPPPLVHVQLPGMDVNVPPPTVCLKGVSC